MNFLTTSYKELDRTFWDDFVHNHPNGNIFHTPEMVELYEATPNYHPIVIAYTNPKNQIEGLLVALIIAEYSGIISRFTARAIVFGGPLVLNQNKEIFSLLLTEFDSICAQKVVFAQFRNLWNINELEKTFTQKGFKFNEHLNIIFNLNKGTEDLWKDIHPTRRKQINRGIKREVQSFIADSINSDQLYTCFEILRQVYSNARLPLPGINYFQEAINIFSNKKYLKVALALYNNQIVGFRFFLCYNGLLYDWYAASLKEHYDKYPNDILPWFILKWGSENSCHTFDFGGAGKPGVKYGVRDYKMKFGGELVNFGRFEKIYKPITYQIVYFAFHLWRRIKSGRSNNQ